ncbi:MAG: RsmE family RNA methyltransferase [Spirochaetia bacterium]|nr:RsmE family RNA methyltransferase [Spirochaetia bacterium]
MNIILFEQHEPLGLLSVDDYRSIHIMSVLKLKIGESFIMGVINLHQGIGTIVDINKESIHYTYQQTSLGVPLYPLTLLVGQVRPISMKRILREAVMLGVKKVIISGCDLTEKSYENAKIWSDQEYKKYLLDGAMQAGSPHISDVELIKSVYKVPLTFDNLILLDNILPSTRFSSTPLKGSTLLAIGPERGFSDKERSFFIHSGFTVHSLGRRILRTETACSVGVGLALSCMNYL